MSNLIPKIRIKHSEDVIDLIPNKKLGKVDVAIKIRNGYHLEHNLFQSLGGFPRKPLRLLGPDAFLVKVSVTKLKNENFLKSFEDKMDIMPVYFYKRTKYIFQKKMIFILKSELYKRKLEKFIGNRVTDDIPGKPIYLVEFESISLANKLNDKLIEGPCPEWIESFEISSYSFESETLFNYILTPNPNCKYSFGKPFALTQIGLYKNGVRQFFAKRKVRIGVFDVGVDNEHPDLKKANNDMLGYDFVEDCIIAIPEKNSSHGTKVAGLIGGTSDGKKGVEGIIKDSLIIDYRIGYEDGEDKFRVDQFLLMKAFYKAALKDKVDVINCSWGLDVPHPTLKYVIDEITQIGRDGKGTIVVSAGGNDGDNTLKAPAVFSSTIGVTGVDEDDIPKTAGKWKSNYGTGADIAAPSVNMITTANSSDTCGGDFNYTNSFSGTSAATPIVTGVVALIISKYPSMSARELKCYITKKRMSGPLSKGNIVFLVLV